MRRLRVLPDGVTESDSSGVMTDSIRALGATQVAFRQPLESMSVTFDVVPADGTPVVAESFGLICVDAVVNVGMGPWWALALAGAVSARAIRPGVLIPCNGA